MNEGREDSIQVVIGALSSGMSLRYVECGKGVREWIRAPMLGMFCAVCAAFEKVCGKLRAFDWPAAGFVMMDDGWMKG